MECGIASEATRAGARRASASGRHFSNVRSQIYGSPEENTKQVTLPWFSQVRYSGETAVWIEKVGSNYELCWTPNDTLKGSLVLNTAIELFTTARQNLAAMVITREPGSLEIRWEALNRGTCRALLIVPKWAPPFPLASGLPVLD